MLITIGNVSTTSVVNKPPVTPSIPITEGKPTEMKHTKKDIK